MKEISKMTEIEITAFMKEPQKEAKELFSNEQHVRKMLELYESIVNGNGGGYNCRVVFAPLISKSFKKAA